MEGRKGGVGGEESNTEGTETWRRGEREFLSGLVIAVCEVKK